MSREHFPSLKEQMIKAMEQRLGAPLAKSVFDHDLWPVLDAAMTAGDLLVARNTVPQTPVHKALVQWMENSLKVITFVRKEEAAVSRRAALRIIYQIEDGAQRALNDARKNQQADTQGSTTANAGKVN